MKTYISKLGLSLVAFALVVVPGLTFAAAIGVSVVQPTDGANVTVNQDVTFQGAGTGGNTATYNYYWKWGDNLETTQANPVVTHRYTTTGPKTVELRITDVLNNTGTKSITVNVVDATTTNQDVVISNVNFSDVTQTEATITWTTNIGATSRVIYDTASHKDANGNVVGSAPNYSYANSTTIDNARVTSHSVRLTGLTPNTHYFFRVLSAK